MGVNGDFAVYKSSGNSMPAKFYSNGSSIKTVSSLTSPAVGTYVCSYGRTTGYSCGSVLQRGVTQTFEDGSVAGNLARGSANSFDWDKGDSGGPVYVTKSTTTAAAAGLITGGNSSSVYFSLANRMATAVGATPRTS